MISASIVIYNNRYKTVQETIKSFSPSRKRVLFVIDNSEQKSDDYNKLPYVTYIFNGKNEGYGKAHNIALHKAIECGSTYHVVLNPDVRFEPAVIDELVNYAEEHSDVVYMLPKVVYPDGELQYLCKLLPTPADLIFRRFLPSSLVKKSDDRYCLKMSGYNKIIDPPCLSGCFMFLRVSTIKQHNLFFDERFFMYCEDFDLMRRLHRVGKTIFYPNVSIIHDHAHASYKSRKMLMIHISSAIKYFHKYGWFFDHERKEMNQKILKEIQEASK